MRRKAVELDEETHEMLKSQAKDAKMGMRIYLRLCLIQCKANEKDKR